MSVTWKPDGTFVFRCETPDCETCAIERELMDEGLMSTPTPPPTPGLLRSTAEKHLDELRFLISHHDPEARLLGNMRGADMLLALSAAETRGELQGRTKALEEVLVMLNAAEMEKWRMTKVVSISEFYQRIRALLPEGGRQQ